MSTRMKGEPQQNFVNGMEVSGIDPQIVREEQQQHSIGDPKLKMGGGVPSQYQNATQQIFNDPAAFQNLIAQQNINQNPLQGGNKVQGMPRRSHRPHISGQGQGQGQQQQQQQQQQQYQTYPHFYMQQNPSGTNSQQLRNAQVQNAAVRAASTSSSVSKPNASRDMMQMTNDTRLVSPPTGSRVGKRRVRLGWTEEETQHLMEGCKRHGVGNWKKILTDPTFDFNCRTAVDLKDRFRTSFPEEYSRLYPNARTHKVKRSGPNSNSASLVKINRKERRSFTSEEDDRLLQGFLKHGPAWSKIQRDPTLNLGERRSTDLRDRFRNAFPERYTAAGYKGRSGQSKSTIMQGQEMGVQPDAMQPIPSMNMLDNDVDLQQHGIVPRSYISQPHMPLQSMQGMGGYQYFGQ